MVLMPTMNAPSGVRDQLAAEGCRGAGRALQTAAWSAWQAAARTARSATAGSAWRLYVEEDKATESLSWCRFPPS